MSKEYSPQELSFEALKRVTYKSILPTAPAAGSEWTTTVPANKIWEILAIHYHLATSATVASRIPKVSFTDGTSQIAECRTVSSQLASLTYEHTLSPNTPVLTLVGGLVGGPIPKLVLNAGAVISSTTDLIQAADQYSQVVIYVKEINVA